MKLIPFLLSVALSFAESRGGADEGALSVEDAVRGAMMNDAAVAVARLSIKEATGRLEDAGRLANPVLETSFAPHVGGRERAFTVGFSQSFPVTARLALEKRISRTEVRVAEAEVAEYERKLALQVRTAAIQLWSVEAQRRLNGRQQENSRELERAAGEAAKAGEGSELEWAQLELEMGRLRAQGARLESSRFEIAGELQALLGVEQVATIRIGPLPDPQRMKADFLGEKRADLRAAEARGEAAREGLSLARASRWEDLTVGVFTEVDRHDDAPTGLETDHIVGVRVSMPLPIWNARKGRLIEAKAGAERAQREATAVWARLRSEVATATNRFAIEFKLLDSISNDLLPKARGLEERLARFQKEGQAAFAEVLRARERRLELESAELEAQREVHLAYARYLAAMGITLK